MMALTNWSLNRKLTVLLSGKPQRGNVNNGMRRLPLEFPLRGRVGFRFGDTSTAKIDSM